jgi:dihydropyrimidinase
MDKIITGGKAVLPTGVVKTDIGIKGEKIAMIGEGLGKLFPDAEKIDAKGHLVIPGVIDVHVHLELPFCGTVSSDDYVSGTRAGARGGVTSLIDFAIPQGKPDGSTGSLSEAADIWHKKAEGKALIDYTFHICITKYHQHINQVKDMVKRGFATFKEFMIYESEGWQSDDGALYGTLQEMKKNGSMLLLHAESSRLIDELVRVHHKPKTMKKYGAKLHAMTRPNVNESEAISRACMWCNETGGQLYIVHMSTGEGTDVIKEHKEKGTPVLAETCAQYLILDDSVFGKKDGHLYACCPQLKKPKDVDRLWEGIAEGTVSVVSTDTCTFTRKQKAMWKGDWTKIPMGMPGLETLLPITYTRGVLEKRITIEQMVDQLSTNPAKIMGLFPKKGAIQVGSDADLAIIHPKNKTKVDYKKMETNADWSPFQGYDFAGFSRTTISRGDVIVDDYKVIDGLAGRGQWLPRKSAGLAN